MKAYQIRIELIGSNPLVWRRFIIPADVTLKDFMTLYNFPWIGTIAIFMNSNYQRQSL